MKERHNKEYKDVDTIIDITPKYQRCKICRRQMKYRKDNGICLDCDTGVQYDGLR